jgi:hypothetical protein
MKSHSFWAALKVGLPICAGIAAGITSSLFVSQRGAHGEEHPAAFAEAPGAPRKAQATTGDDPRVVRSRLAAVEQEIATLRDEKGASDEAVEAAEPSTPAEVRAERQAQMTQASAEFQVKVAHHRVEPMDPSWAEPAARAFETEIRTLTGDGTRPEELAKVDCRSSSCVATISFPSYQAARNGFARYATGAYEIPCARSAVLDEPQDLTAPYDVDILFSQCQRQ